jgi:hypothetical protein
MVMPLIAHYGGIDEIGVFVIPVLLALWALRWADRRARRAEAESEKDETNPDGPGLYSVPDE